MTYRHVAVCFYWEGMRKGIHEYVSHYLVCQQSKYEAMCLRGLLQPLPILDKVWEDISMDFVEGLPKSEGIDTIGCGGSHEQICSFCEVEASLSAHSGVGVFVSDWD